MNIKKNLILCLALLTMACSSNQVSQEVEDDYSSSGLPTELTAQALNQVVDGEELIEGTLFGAANRVNPRIPSYSYFQGMIQADQHLIVAGQVRVVGSVLGSPNGVVNLYSGAMITTNPQAYTTAGSAVTGGPAGMKTRIAKWEEIPTP